MSSNDRQDSRQGGGKQNRDKTNKQNAPLPDPVKAAPLPKDYVQAAEDVMRSLFQANQAKRANRTQVTTSKLRGFLTLVSDIYNTESLRTEAELTDESKLKLMRLRARIVYDAGRAGEVKEFVQKAKLLEYLKDVGASREKMILLAHYMEALVAYHRYFGGKES